jgi:gliding motility-associated lipoprotein GldH
MKSLVVIAGCLIVLLSSCQEGRVYDTIVDIEESKWNEQQVLAYSFTIDNPAALYDVYYSVRYTNDYPFYNLYVMHILCDSTGKELGRKLNGMDIFWSKNGEPRGDRSGFAGTYDYNILAFPKYKFPYKGKYSVKIMQYMRKNPLEGISAFGLRIDQHVKE